MDDPKEVTVVGKIATAAALAASSILTMIAIVRLLIRLMMRTRRDRGRG